MRNLHILFLVLLATNSFSQALTPEFEFQLYFEDAAGNKDTVTLGYDALATGGVDVNFGEENIIDQPWNDSLDVRIGNVIYHGGSPWDGIGGKWCLQPDNEGAFNCDIDTNTHLSKKQILPSRCLSNNNIPLDSIPGRMTIQFYSSAYPVSVKWDKNKFSETCESSIFIGISDHYNWDAGGAVFLQSSDSIIFNDLGNATKIDNIDMPLPAYYTTDNKKIGVLQFEFSTGVIVGVQGLSKENVNIFPNPINPKGLLRINLEGGYAIFDLMGKIVSSGIIENHSILLPNINNGIYVLKVNTDSNNSYTTKILVQ